MTDNQVIKAFEKAISNYETRNFIKRELKDCAKQIKENLGTDVVILSTDEYESLIADTLDVCPQLSYKDIKSIGRIKILGDEKICTSVAFADGTETKVVLNKRDDYDDPEKAVMWCLLKKCFSSKRGLEKVIYAMEDMQ